MAWRKGSGKRPYVHSGADHFTDGATVSIEEEIVAQQDIRNAIKTLENIRDKLKLEADSFLMGMDAKAANAELLKLPDTYAGIATSIIQDPNVIRSLVNSKSEGTISKQILTNTFQNDKSRVAQKIMNEIGSLEDSIPIEQIAKIIANSIGNAQGTITQTGTRMTKAFSFDDAVAKKVEQEATNGVFKKLRSSQGKIVKIIVDLLKSSNAFQKSNDASSSISQFMKIFTEKFLTKVKANTKIYYADFTPEQYLKNLQNELTTVLQKDITEIRNAAGITNEDILAAVYKADNSVVLQITATGKMDENELIKKFSNLHQMNTFHDKSKESLTDMVLVNQNGMSVRAQSKTSLREYTVTGDENIRILNHLQRSINIYELLTRLNDMDLFPINNIDDICYAIANALWFNSHISVSGERDTGYFSTKRAHYPDLLPQVINALNAALGIQAPLFLGVSLQKTSDQIVTDVRGSNIFYIENGNLVPTYIELNEIINDLNNYINQAENASKNLKFTIENSNVSWADSNAKHFWLQKYGDGTYDATPGFEQGEAAISSINVHGNFSALTQFTSYRLG